MISTPDGVEAAAGLKKAVPKQYSSTLPPRHVPVSEGPGTAISSDQTWLPAARSSAAPRRSPRRVAPPQLAPAQVTTRPIPSSGEALPVVGLGTYLNFDVVPGSPAYGALPAVLDALFAAGGTVIDSSPMYARAEETTGEPLAARAPRVPAFLATKVWTTGRDAGRAQMEASFRLLRTEVEAALRAERFDFL